MEAFGSGIPILEPAVGFGQIGVIQIAGIKGVIEGGGRDAVKHHVSDRQDIHIAHQEHIAQAARAPFSVEEALQFLGVVPALGLLQNGFERLKFGGTQALLMKEKLLERGFESTGGHDQQPLRAGRGRGGLRVRPVQ